MQLIMRRPEVNKFIAISPQPNVYDFTFLAPCPISGLIVFANNETGLANKVEPIILGGSLDNKI